MSVCSTREGVRVCVQYIPSPFWYYSVDVHIRAYARIIRLRHATYVHAIVPKRRGYILNTHTHTLPCAAHAHMNLTSVPLF
jgi:hypothetical protein